MNDRREQNPAYEPASTFLPVSLRGGGSAPSGIGNGERDRLVRRHVMMRIRFEAVVLVGEIPDFPGYEVLRELGVGGMSRVFLARQRSLGRLVAIKLMRASGDEREQVEKRFLLEGRTMARLPHRNIAAIYDIVQRPDATYIAMEFLEGGTLSDRMRGGLSLAEAVAITVQLAQALQFAHDQGVIHRDLKPSNVMFRDPQTPVLTDFGIARQRDTESMRLTQTGMLIGTPTYMSPEQIQGHEVDGRSDLYSLGVMFYELLTGQPPFRGETPVSVLMAHLTQKPPPLPEQFAAFQPVIDRCLAKDPKDRYSSVREFIRALKSIVLSSQTLMATLASDPDLTASEQLRALGFSISHPAIGDVERAAEEAKRAIRSGDRRAWWRRLGRRPLLPWLAAAAVLAGLAVGVWYVASGGSRLPPEVLTLVERSIARADQWIEEGRLTEPPERNALAELETVARLAPNHPALAERRARLADALAERVLALAAAGEGGRAALLLSHFRALAAGSPREQELEAAVAAANEREAAEKIQDALIEAAERALAEGDLDTALAKFAEAAGQIPEEPRVRIGLERLARSLLAPVEQALSEGRPDQALALLEELRAPVVETNAYREVAARLRLARDQRDQARRALELGTRLREQIAARRWLAEEGDSAVATLLEVRRSGLDARPEFARMAAEVASALQREAEAALRRNEPERALIAVFHAIRLKPGDRAMRALETRIENALGIARARALRSLEDAKIALAEGRLLSPEFESARFYLRSALLAEPGNAEAERMLRELPRIVQRTAEQALLRGELERAQALAQEVRRYYGDRLAEFPFLAEVGRLIEERRRRELIEQRAAAVERLLAVDPLPIAQLAARIEEDLRALRESGERDLESRRLRRALLVALRRVLNEDGDAAAAGQLAEAVRRGSAGEPLFLDYAARLSARATAASMNGGS